MENIRVAFLGPVGTFSHQAANDIFAPKYNAQGYKTFSAAFNSLVDGASDLVVVPIENSIEGVVTPVADLLISSKNIHIHKSYTMDIEQVLISKKQNHVPFIVDKLFSHPQALSQCSTYLDKLRATNGDKMEIIPTNSTAEAVEMVKKESEKEPFFYAIGSKIAAELYGLEALTGNIADNKNNQTRFFVLSKNQNDTHELDLGNFKTFIIFSVADKPGALVRILEIFDVLDINMNSINSRPAKTAFGQYFFLVEINGHKKMDNIKVALDQIKKKAKSLKVLGSY